MKRKTMSIAALGMSLVLMATAAPAIADEGDPLPAATVALGGASSILTLPAADGVRDTATFALTSDIATTVALDVVGEDDTTVVKTLTPVELTADVLSATVTVDVAGLPSGLLSLRATPTEGEAVSSPVRVGSGKPAAVKLALSPKTIYTWSGSSARSTVASVSAVDETELAIPFTGTVTAVVGSVKHIVTVISSRGSTAKATIPASRLTAGTGKVTATVTGNGKKLTSDAASLVVRKTSVASAKISRSTSVVYPTKDGYKDSVAFSVSWKSSTGGTIPARGTVKIVNSKGKTVKVWTKSSSKNWAVAWNGKIGSTAVYGTYKVVAAVKGPEGSTLTSSTTVAVKKGKLVERTLKSTVKADTVLKQYTDYGYYSEAECWHDYYAVGDVFCIGYDGDAGISVISTGRRAVPDAVVRAQKYATAKVKLTANVTSVYGDAAWGYGRVGSDTAKATRIDGEGKLSAGWLSLPATTRKLDVFMALGEFSFASLDKITIEYRYKVLSTS